MKQLFFSLLTTAVLMTACQNEDKKAAPPNPDPLAAQQNADKVLADSANFTTLEWIDSADQHLEKVQKGQELEITYRFKNTGTKPLIILTVQPGCGCTTAEKPEKPIMPGEEGVIKTKFDTKNQAVGPKDKTVTVTANTSKSNTTTRYVHALAFHT